VGGGSVLSRVRAKIRKSKKLLFANQINDDLALSVFALGIF
jgi:hypothetical protein